MAEEQTPAPADAESDDFSAWLDSTTPLGGHPSDYPPNPSRLIDLGSAEGIPRSAPLVILAEGDEGFYSVVNLAAAAGFMVTWADRPARWTTLAKFGGGEHPSYDLVEVPGLAADSYEEAAAKFRAFARDVLNARVYKPEGT